MLTVGDQQVPEILVDNKFPKFNRSAHVLLAMLNVVMLIVILSFLTNFRAFLKVISSMVIQLIAQ